MSAKHASRTGACGAAHCPTCADEAVQMRVLATDPALGLAACADGDGHTYTVEVALVEPVGPGDRLLVHAGVALVALAPESASTPSPGVSGGGA